MTDQGSGIESGGFDNKSARRMSEAIPNPRDDQIQQPANQTEGSPSKDEEQYLKAGRRSTPRDNGLSRNGLNRNSFQHSTRSSPEPTTRPMEPPVTKATLSELDVAKIIHNPRLRHDINFDPELHFRPNLDGEKGRRKQQKADQFWDTLRDQLQQFITDRDGFIQQYGNGEDWSLPLLLRSVKEIIQTLVPARDRLCLDEGLNVELIMQQFSRGMADLEKLASWLSGVLKSHCAPMRDEWVDQMYSQLTNGNRTNNMAELVQGLRNLLSVLEAMKLDVANHQIRCLRPILIEDTVHFEQRFFLKKMRDGKVNTRSAQTWYSHLSPVQDPVSVQAFGEMAVFFEELINMTMPSSARQYSSLPTTFLFDEERIAKLRCDILDAINLEVCMRLYETYETVDRNMSHCDPTMAVPSPYLATPLSDASGFLSSRTEDEGSEFNFNAPSRPSSMVFSSAGSAHSSPRSSLIAPTVPAVKSQEELRSRSQELYDSLVALVQSSTTSSRASRWRAMNDSLALQIFRFTNASTDMLESFEKSLNMHVGDVRSPTDGSETPYSALFQSVEDVFRDRLRAELQQRVKDLKGLTGVNLFSVATGGRLQGHNRSWDISRDSVRDGERDSSTRGTREEAGVDDMAIRLAHMGLIHWRVWSQLVYVSDVDNDVLDDDVPMVI
ncbi:camp-mediated signaling protein Sok1 [Xylaria bambusicola]|uniref:camp-mediated signaling protein Sok1 n=1 Tax=Xylaria bambusicola TaxID=326684 RepID=UPI00200751F7|nr:camp-mediated signaling protein Sok1 [Xylaria bambusicola]KAI0518350.1 camp-mediated signaling protein Sok1 [Xylaria bambusicola]